MIRMNMIAFTLTAMILIGMIMIVRKIGRGKLKTKYIVFIWQLVILRLLIPFSFTCQIVPLNWMQSFTNNMRNSFVIRQLEKNEENVEQVQFACSMADDEWVNDVQLVRASKSQKDLQYVLMLIWSVGCVGMLSYFYLRFSKSNRIIQEALVIDETLLPGKWREEQKKDIKVYVSDRIISPITVGMFKGKIILPKHITWNKEEMLNVLVHESIHIRKRHVLWKRIALLALCIHWFNPIVWIMQCLFGKDIELACDEQVIEQIGDEKRKSYALSLINLAEKTRGIMFLESGFGKNDIEERVVAVMDGKRKSKLITILLLGLCMSGVGASVIAAEQQKITGMAQENSIGLEEVVGEGKAMAFDWYNDYKAFGMTYDREKDNFYYKGELVCQFVDYLPNSNGKCRFFCRPVKGYVLEATRDSKGMIRGIKEVGYEDATYTSGEDEEEWHNDLLACEENEGDNDANEIDEGAYACEIGDDKDNKQDKEMYKPYEAYGLTYNEAKCTLYYKGKKVKVFVDIAKPGDSFYILEINCDGEVLVEAVRDKNGVLKGIRTIDKETLKKLLEEEKSENIDDFIESMLE